MSRRGPKPKPTALRMFEGDPGRLLSHRKGEPMPVSGGEVPPPPEWLGEVGRQKWAQVAPSLFAVGLLTSVDVDLLALWAAAWDEYTAASELIIGKAGLLLVNDKKNVHANPAVLIRARAAERIRAIGAMFGIGPTSRVGLKPTQTGGNAMDAYKKQGRG